MTAWQNYLENLTIDTKQVRLWIHQTMFWEEKNIVHLARLQNSTLIVLSLKNMEAATGGAEAVPGHAL